MGSPPWGTIPAPIISEDSNPVPPRLRVASYWALAVVFIAVYFASMFSPALLDDVDSVTPKPHAKCSYPGITSRYT